MSSRCGFCKTPNRATAEQCRECGSYLAAGVLRGSLDSPDPVPRLAAEREMTKLELMEMGLTTREEKPMAHVVRDGGRVRAKARAVKAAGLRCGECMAVGEATASYCHMCGSPLATVKAAAALRSAGFYREPDPAAREVIYKRVTTTLTKSARARDSVEVALLREARNSCDPDARLTAERELAKRGLIA